MQDWKRSSSTLSETEAKHRASVASQATGAEMCQGCSDCRARLREDFAVVTLLPLFSSLPLHLLSQRSTGTSIQEVQEGITLLVYIVISKPIRHC